MRSILRHLELLLTFAGLAVIFLVTALVASDVTSEWQVAAITATLVGIVHGILFWVIRHRQRRVRAQAIKDMQGMLKDVINNQLTVIQGMDFIRNENPDQAQRATDRIARSVTSISDALQHLSDESLRAWRNKYNFRDH
eukprot:gene2104-biopygen1865